MGPMGRVGILAPFAVSVPVLQYFYDRCQQTWADLLMGNANEITPFLVDVWVVISNWTQNDLLR